ncbi:MAG: HNH endonuclease [Solirubrobacteraceae bacterium]
MYVGVTDYDWYTFLRERPALDEVNFWQPSGGRRFSVIEPGDLFMFKLHYPANAIVGGGTFISFDRFPAWLAWDAFGEKNGAASYDEMCRRIERYRRRPISPAGNEPVGCIILADAFFFDEADWVSTPSDWAPNIVQGKTYGVDTGDGARLFDQILARRAALALAEGATAVTGSQPVLFREALGRRRLGQGTFQLMILDAYGRRCAVSGEKALPVLQSAHVRPVTRGGEHRIDNGLLLRSDIHTLFDRGYATITPGGEFKASRRLKSDYDNGEPYYLMETRAVALPSSPSMRPSREFLEWHNKEVFLG